jgi:hypothetical protein
MNFPAFAIAAGIKLKVSIGDPKKFGVTKWNSGVV